MSNPELGRLLRSLSTISAAQMELGPEPAVARRSLVPVWIIGYFAIANSQKRDDGSTLTDPSEKTAERKISSESTGSEKSTESIADAYEMKQLKYYPDINFPPSLQLLITAHSELGTCSWCTDGNARLLKFILREFLTYRKALSQEKDITENHTRLNIVNAEISQVVYCLIQYPSKRPKGIADHRSPKIPMVWADIGLLLRTLLPDELPQFDSVKASSITHDLALLLKRIIKLIPNEEFDKMRITYHSLHKFVESPDKRDETEWLNVANMTSSVLKNVYYLLGDYYMKNNDRSSAVKNYLMDIAFNPSRFDSWAALALCKAADIEDKLRSFEISSIAKIDPKKICAAKFSFDRALQLENNGKILIEYAQCLYWLATHSGQRCPKLLSQAEKMFDQALLAIPEEEWLVLYMKGKIHEKMGDVLEPIQFYFDALDWMDGYAQYPKKIQYKMHSGDYSHETLEIFYRINAVILKAYEKHYDILKLQDVIKKLTNQPFYNRNGNDEDAVIFARHKSYDSSDRILAQIIKNLKICIGRFPQHYKSYYRLARLAILRNDLKSARRILVGVPQNSTSNILDTLDRAQNMFCFDELPSFFAERTRTNLFGGIWRTPSGDIDRPGSFSRHLSRCCDLSIKCLTHLGEPVLLTTMYSGLSRVPEQSRRYLKEEDRERISKDLPSSIIKAIEILSNRQLCGKEAQDRVVQIQRVLEAVQKKSIGNEAFGKIQTNLKAAYMSTYPDQTNVTLDQINKFVKAIYSMRKARADNDNASTDYRDYLKSSQKKEEKQTNPIRSNSTMQKMAQIVPAPIPSQSQSIIPRVNLRPEITANKSLQRSPLATARSVQRSPLTTAQSVLVQELLTKLAQNQLQNPN